MPWNPWLESWPLDHCYPCLSPTGHCIHNVVAASAVVGLVGREGAVIRKTFWPFMYYAGVSGCLGYAIVWHSKEGWVNLGSVLLTLILIGMVWFAARELRKTNQ